MAGVRIVAAVVSLLNGVWGVVAGIYPKQVFGVQSLTGSGDFWLLAVGALLVLGSMACFVGLQTAYYVSAALAILLVVDMLLFGAPISDLGFILSALFGLITVVLDLIATRRKPIVSEENHPLNLPVFG